MQTGFLRKKYSEYLVKQTIKEFNFNLHVIQYSFKQLKLHLSCHCVPTKSA